METKTETKVTEKLKEIPDIEEKCLKLCKQYLASNWKQQTIDTIEVRQTKGGITNQIYYCGIKSQLSTTNVPQEVVIRFYGEKFFNKMDEEKRLRLTDVVIGVLVSENHLGPKLYGIFDDGQIIQFYKHRQFRIEEQKKKELVTEVFRKLARVHAMDVPIKKSHFLLKELDMYYEMAERSLKNYRQMIEESNFKTLRERSLKDELIWIKGLIEKSKSPMIFSHNDFGGHNIMILEDNDNNNCDSKIVFCDYEYSSYNYRGYDFANLIMEWGRRWNDSEDTHPFADDFTIKGLIDIYIKESEKIFGKSYSENKINSVEHILKEVKVFALVLPLLFALSSLRDDGMERSDRSVTIEFTENTFKKFCHLKQRFIAERQGVPHNHNTGINAIIDLIEDQLDFNENQMIGNVRLRNQDIKTGSQAEKLLNIDLRNKTLLYKQLYPKRLSNEWTDETLFIADDSDVSHKNETIDMNPNDYNF